MLQVESMTGENYDKTISFLSSVPSIKGIEDNIVNNGVIILDNEKVIGSMSYEVYDKLGLIRYFVFKRNLPNTILIELLDNLELNASKQDIKKLVCIADSQQVMDLFIELGFEKLDKKIFINEEIVSNTQYRNSHFLVKNVKK